MRGEEGCKQTGAIFVVDKQLLQTNMSVFLSVTEPFICNCYNLILVQILCQVCENQ
jgi:hypothetical protein